MSHKTKQDHSSLNGTSRRGSMLGFYSRRKDHDTPVALENLKVNPDLSLSGLDLWDDSIDETFLRSAYDLEGEADEYLQSQMCQRRVQHPYEQ